MASVGKYYLYKRKWKTPSGKQKTAWTVEMNILEGNRLKQRYRKSGFTTKTLADEHRRDIEDRVKDGSFFEDKDKKPDLSFKEFSALYLEHGTAGKRPRSVTNDELAIKWFSEHVSPETKLSRIGHEEIDSYVAKRLKTRSEATVKRELTTLRRMFALAVRWGYLESNPTNGIKRPVEPEKGVVFLEDHEIKSLLAACSLPEEEDQTHNANVDAPYLRPLVALALNTGLRAGELFNLRWDDLDFERKRLTVRNSAKFRTKSKKNRVLELNAAAIRELEAWKAYFTREIARARLRAADKALHLQLRQKAEVRLEILLRCEARPGRLVFPSFRSIDLETGEALPLDNVKKSLHAAKLEAFGVPTGEKDEEGNPVLELPERYRKVGLHALRHTFAVHLARAGVPLTKIKEALGHADIKTTQIYLRFSPSEGADVTRLLPDWGDNSKILPAYSPHGVAPVPPAKKRTGTDDSFSLT